MNVLNISFSQNFPIRLNHFKIRWRKLLGHNLWLSFIEIFTVESDAFALTSGFHAETVITILKVNTSW